MKLDLKEYLVNSNDKQKQQQKSTEYRLDAVVEHKASRAAARCRPFCGLLCVVGIVA
jgi:hypothetical protein